MPVDMAIELAKAEFDGVLLAAVVRGLRAGILVRDYGGAYRLAATRHHHR